jgi:hypothetical protein
LPIDESSAVLPLEFCFSSGRNFAVNTIADQVNLQAWAEEYASTISDIAEELLGDVSSEFWFLICQFTELFRITSLLMWIFMPGYRISKAAL